MPKPRDEDSAAPARDPIRSIDFIVADLGLSRSSVYRLLRRTLPFVQLSPRRIGVRQSVLEQLKKDRSRLGT